MSYFYLSPPHLGSYNIFSLKRLILALLLICSSNDVSANDKSSDNNKVLFVISSDARGYWLPEVVEPYVILQQAGLSIDVASPSGGQGVQRGVRGMGKVLKRWLEQSKLNTQLNDPIALNKINTDTYRAVYFAGGAGPMFDFTDNKEVHRVTREIYENGGVIAADCHGPAALINVTLSDGSLLIKGRNITAKSNAEEGWWARTNYPYLLEDKIKALGGHFSAAKKGQPHAVVDGQLITGQNPASARLVAEKIQAALLP